MTNVNKKCVICSQVFNGIGANAFPISHFGECCNSCDTEKVIPARILQQEYSNKYGADLGEKCILGLIHLGMGPEKTVEIYKNSQIKSAA